MPFLVGGSVLLWKHFEPDTRPTGELNIAIAPFTGGKQQQGQDLAIALHKSIDDQRVEFKAKSGMDAKVVLLRAESPGQAGAAALADGGQREHAGRW